MILAITALIILAALLAISIICILAGIMLLKTAYYALMAGLTLKAICATLTGVFLVWSGLSHLLDIIKGLRRAHTAITA